MRIGLLEPNGFSEAARARLRALGPVEDFDGTDLPSFVVDKEALFVRLGYAIDKAFLSRAAALKVLCSPTTGHTHIDLEELARRGIALLSLKGETAFLDGIRATPEHALGLILALLRNYRTAFLSPGDSHWDRDRCRGEELYHMPVGLIGFGRVGWRLASYLKAFDALVGYYDPNVDGASAGVIRYESMAALLAASRVVVLAASHRAGDPPIMDRDAILALTGKYFVNIARGELVDEEALLAALRKGALAGCAVDVIHGEAGVNNRPRWVEAAASLNVIVTPHIAGATYRSMKATEEFVAEKLIAAANAGAAAPTRVAP